MSKVETLSSEQWAAIERERERWVAIGTCTEPADRSTTEEVITDFYRRMGKNPPAFVWDDGPRASCLAADATAGNQFERHRQFYNKLKGQLGAQLSDQVGSQFSDQIRRQLWDHLGGKLWDQLWYESRLKLMNQIGLQLQSQIGLDSLVYNNAWLQAQPAIWVGYFATYRDVVGVTYSPEVGELLRQTERLAAASGWLFPYDGTCFCSERHEHIRFDAERRLHCEDGPAILCRDGFAVHAWHGTGVPAEWIEDPAKVDPALALTWNNVEQRRCLAEILGWGKVLEQLEPTVVDEDTPEVGKLLRVDLPGSPGEQFLQVRCGTGRDFVLAVPRDVTTARQANAWTYGLDAGEWAPEVRT